MIRNLLTFAILTIAAWPGFVLGQQVGDELDQQVTAIFQARCVNCHDSLGEDSAGGDIAFLLQFDQLIEDGIYIDRDDPESSYLLEVVPDEMPKKKMRDISWQGPLNDDELAAFRQWVKRGGPSQKWLDDQSITQRVLIRQDDLTGMLVADLAKLQGLQLRNAHYLTITNLHNDPQVSSSQLSSYRAAISKSLNSLSRQSDVVVPVPVDDQQTVFRFDLRDLGWQDSDWEALVRHYPYEIQRRGGAGKSLSQLTSSDLPQLRADWFVFAATQPPLYHQLVGIPANLSELEDRLFGRSGAREENIRTARCQRAGFGDSGVSVNNRLVERHTIPTGFYWISYDFASNDGKQNLTKFPLGPPNAGVNAEFEFEHDGGEVIFSLPNGFQAYGLFDAAGNRINKGPTNIVHDDSMTGGAIINGISCISCHDRGMKPENQRELVQLDRVRKLATHNLRRFDEATRNRIEELYPTGQQFAKLVREDRRRFESAMEKAGLSNSGDEPVRALFNQFIADVNVESVAAELGVSADELRQRLDREGETRQILMRLEDEGLKRQLFLTDFQIIVRLGGFGELREFVPLNFPFFGATDVEVESDPNATNSSLGQTTGVALLDQDHFQGELQVSLATAGGQKHYRQGEAIRCEISASAKCHVTVFALDPTGELTVLVPNKWHPEGLSVKAGEKLIFPTPAMGFELYAQPPHGPTILKAVATRKPLAISGINAQKLQQDAMVNLGNTKGLQTKGIGVRGAAARERKPEFDLTSDDPNSVFQPNEWATSRWTIITHAN